MEVVAQINNRRGDAPLWDPQGSRLLWVDVESSLVLEWSDGAQEPNVLSRGLRASGLALHERREQLVLAGETGVHLWRGQDDFETVAAEFEGEKLALNDVLADPAGRLYAGTCHWVDGKMKTPGRLYLFDVDGEIQVLDDGILLSGGLALSPDDGTLYYVDSAARTIFAYDINRANGEVFHRRVFVRVGKDEGLPDGLCVDSEGFVWSAQWYGGQIVRYDPDGKVERRVPLPVKQVASLNFGGADLCDLFVTTASAAWNNPLAPPGFDFGASDLGGPLYRIRVDVPGLDEYRVKLAPAKKNRSGA
ncbi:MAG: SMP-30/gluconolactonase/LRE family protein [Pirellulales bacterium]|nr:SMP-30/gluconolactonase/LRE family protein [Pirellulales bacterium]